MPRVDCLLKLVAPTPLDRSPVARSRAIKSSLSQSASDAYGAARFGGSLKLPSLIYRNGPAADWLVLDAPSVFCVSAFPARAEECLALRFASPHWRNSPCTG